jgi:hypothetical protein
MKLIGKISKYIFRISLVLFLGFIALVFLDEELAGALANKYFGIYILLLGTIMISLLTMEKTEKEKKPALVDDTWSAWHFFNDLIVTIFSLFIAVLMAVLLNPVTWLIIIAFILYIKL